MTNVQKLAEISVQIRKLKKERDYILATIANEMDIKTSEMKAYAVELCEQKNVPFSEIQEGYRFPDYVYIKHLICSKYYTQVPTSSIAELLNVTTQQVRYLAVNYTNYETKFKHTKKRINKKK
jgi:hypothetical protein